MEPFEAAQESNKKQDNYVIKGQGVRVIQIFEKEIMFSDLRPGMKFKAWNDKGQQIKGPKGEEYFESLDTVLMDKDGFTAETKPLKERPKVLPSNVIPKS